MVVEDLTIRLPRMVFARWHQPLARYSCRVTCSGWSRLARVPASLSIRVGESTDIAKCREIDLATQHQFAAVGHPEFLSSGVIPDRAAERAIQARRLLVAEIGGQVVGWAFLTRSDGELCIGQLAVAPPSQRRGVGTALVDAVIADARHNGEGSIVLSTQSDVEWNQPWYERIGFKVVPPQHWTADMATIAREQSEAGLDWETRVHMRMRLTPA